MCQPLIVENIFLIWYRKCQKVKDLYWIQEVYMKVLMLNGSAKENGNTYNALLEIGKELEKAIW